MLNMSPGLLMAVGASKATAELVAPFLEKYRTVPGDAFNTITSKNGIAMFVAQTAEESGCYTAMSENLNYSADALRTGNRAKYFTQAQAQRYGYVKDVKGVYTQRADQRMIANLYYGGRMGNYGVDTDDGWDFRGGGWIQLTGRNNITAYGKAVGLSPAEAAASLRTPEGATHSAYWFWRQDKRILSYASRGDVTSVSELINTGSLGSGGVINLNTRVDMFRRALAFLS